MKATQQISVPFYQNPAFVGTFWGIVSAVTYAITNILLRQLAADNDPIWITCMKALPTFVWAAILVAHQWWCGSLIWPSARAIAAIVAAALFVQIGGNVLWQWSLGVIGLALTVPLSFGTLISASGLMGRIWLAEPLTPRALISMALLIASIAVLTLGAEETHPYVNSQLAMGNTLSALGVIAACIAGIAFALVAVVLRTAVRRTTVSVTLFLISGTGVALLGAASIARLGPVALARTDARDFIYMVAAGTFNAIGFFALAKSLRVVSVVHANVLNASQAAIAVVAGIAIFHEPGSWPLVFGVLLTIAGLVVVRSDAPADG